MFSWIVVVLPVGNDGGGVPTGRTGAKAVAVLTVSRNSSVLNIMVFVVVFCSAL